MAEDRSLPSGMSIPQWMKTRMNDRLDFDHNTFSPPEVDSTFLHIKYNKDPSSANTGQSIKPNIQHTVVSDKSATASDFSKHTDPCKKFIENNKSNSNTGLTKDFKLKSNGTDDGFKGDAAACGSSVIRVAHQMVTGKFGHRNLTIPEEEPATEPPNFNRGLRRGSKSLPSSPLTSPNTSPKSRRRMPNKYFGAATIDLEKVHGSWILSSLLKKGKLSQSVTTINEEEPHMNESLAKSVSQMSVDDAAESKPQLQKKTSKNNLRELNFFSPTSM